MFFLCFYYYTNIILKVLLLRWWRLGLQWCYHATSTSLPPSHYYHLHQDPRKQRPSAAHEKDTTLTAEKGREWGRGHKGPKRRNKVSSFVPQVCSLYSFFLFLLIITLFTVRLRMNDHTMSRWRQQHQHHEKKGPVDGYRCLGPHPSLAQNTSRRVFLLYNS